MQGSSLGRHWSTAWQQAGLVPDSRSDALRERLLDAWAEPQRHYHTPQHLAECLALAEQQEAGPAVRLALWFHDAVYDPHAADNEERSADWARTELESRDGEGGDASLPACVHGLVMATRHGAPDASSGPQSATDTRLMLDIDLAVLGAAPARFDEYDRQIRAEYAFVPEATYREKRAAVLRGFVDRSRIFLTDALGRRLEEPARDNLARALARLAA